MRWAPARPMITELSCWEIWLMGLLKLLDSWRKAAMTPRVMPVSKPPRAMKPPAMATMTYWMLPMLIMMGMRMLAYLLA